MGIKAMHVENDDNFTFLFNEEFEKIPWLFRFSKRRFKGSLITIGVFFIAGLVCWHLFLNSAKYTVINTVDAAHKFGFNEYNYVYLFLLIICFAVIVVITGWMSLAKLFEQRAYKKASNLSNRIFLSERHRKEVEWQNWKMHNRDY